MSEQYAHYFELADQAIGSAMLQLRGIPFDAPTTVRAEAQLSVDALRDQRIKTRAFAQRLRDTESQEIDGRS